MGLSAGLAAVAILIGLGTAPSEASGGDAQPLRVAAAEGVWGSLAQQLGGDEVQVSSVVTDPNADPHEYESTSADARAFADARLVILNGAGYDTWASRLLSAGSGPHRLVLNVAEMMHRGQGANPHFWYNPTAVFRVMGRITQDLKRLRPRATAYFSLRLRTLEKAFGPYRARLQEIRREFAGARVAATESIFQYLARYLHLKLITPPSFMRAVSDGIDPAAGALVTFEQQLQEGRFSVLVYNRQTVSPLITQLVQQTRARRIPVVAVSETIDPEGLTFQAWMTKELTQLQRALKGGARA